MITIVIKITKTAYFVAERMDNKDLYANVDFRKAGAVDGY